MMGKQNAPTPNPEGWEEQFDKRFGDFAVQDKSIKLTIAGSVFVTDGAERVKAFIRDLLATERAKVDYKRDFETFTKARDDLRAALIQEIEGMKLHGPERFEYSERYSDLPAGLVFNWGLDAVLEKLKEKEGDK